MSEENKAAFRRVTDAFSSRDFSAFDDRIAPEMVEHNPAPRQAPGPEGMKQMAGMFRTAFPDARITVEDLIAEGDKVAGRMSFTGANTGEFMGAPATGKSVTIQEIHICRFSGGKMVEHWGLEDSLGMMQQLGLIPEMG